MRNLKILSLRGEFCRLFGLLHQLILPGILDRMELTGFNSTVEDVSQTLVPYMRDYYRRDGRFQDRLELSSSSSYSPCGSIGISVNVAWDENSTLEQDSPDVEFKVHLDDQPPPDVLERLFVDLATLIPGERIVHFNANLDMKSPEELLSMMPNIKRLHVVGVELSKGFLQPNPSGPRANTKLLPSLGLLYLEDVILNDDGWTHLMTYLAHQTSDGQTILLEMVDEFPYMSPEVVKKIKCLVSEFVCQGDPETEEDE